MRVRAAAAADERLHAPAADPRGLSGGATRRPGRPAARAPPPSVHAPTDARTTPNAGMKRTTMSSSASRATSASGSADFHETSVERPRGPAPRARARRACRRARRPASRRARGPTPSRPPRTPPARRASRRCACRSGSRGPAARRPPPARTRARSLRIGHRAVAGPRDEQVVEALRAHVQAAAALRPAQPLLTRRGVEVAAELVDVDRDRADRLGGVEQHRHAGRRQRRACRRSAR